MARQKNGGKIENTPTLKTKKTIINEEDSAKDREEFISLSERYKYTMYKTIEKAGKTLKLSKDEIRNLKNRADTALRNADEDEFYNLKLMQNDVCRFITKIAEAKDLTNLQLVRITNAIKRDDYLDETLKKRKRKDKEV